MTKISDLAKNFKISEIRQMAIECRKVKGINLSQGDCDLDTPSLVTLSAKQAMDRGENKYSQYHGINSLKKAITKKLERFNKIKVDYKKNILVTAGSTAAAYCSFLALLNPGDEVILFEPYYGYHKILLEAVKAKPVYVQLRPPTWIFDINELEKIVTQKTKGIIICTPANPSGKIFTREELELLAKFVVRHDLIVFTDEIYEYIIYDDGRHISPASIKSLKERTVTISGYSKTFAITGWRIGYVVANEQWMKAIGTFSDLIYVCAPTPLQHGVTGGITRLTDRYYQSLKSEFTKRRDKICKVLGDIGLKPFIPQGAYYVLADATQLPGKTSKEKAMCLLKKTKVAAVPGSAFYHDKSGEKFLRFCYAVKDEILDEACRRLLKLKNN